MIVSCSEMKALEATAFAKGVSPEALMEEAGRQIALAVQHFFPSPGDCTASVGKGHNAGDALVALRHLAAAGWGTSVRAAFDESEWSPLTRKKFAEFGETRSRLRNSPPLVVLDGLLGIGAVGPLREPVATAAREINRLRREENAHVFALDLPTGLNGDSGEAELDAITADFTLAIGFAKRGLVADSAARHVGRLAVLPLDELAAHDEMRGNFEQVTTAATLEPLFSRRAFDVHKGDFGRVGIVAGSRGLTGAAVMCADACVRAGAGLVSLYVTEDIYSVVASSASPEVMVRPVTSYLEVLEKQRDVLALGPGLGEERRDEVLEFIARAKQPLILDADALNIVATDWNVLERCAGPRLLTPHPGEMARLAPSTRSLSRQEIMKAFIGRVPHTLLLKGARTLVGERGRPLSYNTTGSPGMATGGMGDVLTGVCAALAAQRLSLYDAARAGAWLCGCAAELAIYHGVDSEESLCATGLLDWLGRAFKELRAKSF
jgi:NAD(P)H-hydrate epimerase